MNTKFLAIIAILFAIVGGLFFLIIDISVLSICAYVLFLIGIAGAYYAFVWLKNNPKSYPWGTSVPRLAIVSLLEQTIVSFTVVVLGRTEIFALNIWLFLIIQLVPMIIFLIKIVALIGGVKEIERVDEKIEENTSSWKSIIADCESVLNYADSNQKSYIKAVVEELKYSDPVSSPNIATFDSVIKDRISIIRECCSKDDSDIVKKQCEETIFLIKDRNNAVKLQK
jgi:hypothetical protein